MADVKEIKKVKVLNNKESKIKEPPMYGVFFHNDDVTTMDFVVYVLIKIFNKSDEEANILMRKVHFEGVARIGVFPRDIAETKVMLVKKMAKDNKYPLVCTFKKV